MKLFSTIIKILSLFTLTAPFVYASDCKDIKKYFDNKKEGYIYISKCKENDNGKVIEITFYEKNIPEKDIEKILSYDTITTLDYSTGYDGYDFEENPEVEYDIRSKVYKLTNLKNLKHLENLSIAYFSEVATGIGFYHYYLGHIAENTLKNLTSLKTLIINLQPENSVKSELVNAFKSVKELVLLEGGEVKFDLPNVEKITYDEDDVSSLGKLENLKELKLIFYPFDVRDISSFKNLSQVEKLTVSMSKIYPGAAGVTCEAVIIKFSDKSQLKELYIDIGYPSKSTIEEAKKLKNLKKGYAECGKCGKEYGKCPSGQCCSKYGWCGASSDHCLTSKGCQSEFGKCSNDKTLTSTTKTSTKKSSTKTSTTKTKTLLKTSTTKTSSTPTVKGKCGKEYGKCPSGQCCSKYGWCGTSSDHCSTSKGCQSEFGKCGKEYGKCPSGQCCSKYGWCGTSSDHCLTSKGCQSEFGTCK
ncbi:hypothetical protein BCR32DRAFT_283840 [Anaeromyces robustus]|uniref:Chitin-binding type-1 domain-containing protein n=1 Tax=Anaeromyces robustus TaxID=1754192 RepID=A0A1Y1WT99_9FUNG|nr:hypothetical protein BCR32DRAFT_283840 [Anaeromyces robustus]|eukprot:ORX76761.1 hypothetical protein BCR32DRAFT_283840 [Anaeromyces robustus]